MKRRLLALFIVLSAAAPAHAQDFLLQAWYWDYPKTCNGNNWAQTLQSQVATMANGGFTYVWLPPLSRASSGNCSNGYDPKDLFDLGEFGGGATGFGTRADVDNLIAALNAQGLKAVADVVYNHRDGGLPENNPPVKDYITIYYDASKNPFPSDRFRCILPLGGSSGNGAGDYYFKISSKTGDGKFHGKPYKVYMETSLVGWQGLADTTEVEPNGGGDCGQANNTITLGRNWLANVDSSGCLTDEFHLNLQASDFNAAGDNLYIYITNLNSDYSDHRIYGIWSANADADIVGQLQYQTWTDFTSMPSGRGDMNYDNFKPNSSNASTTGLSGDWDWLWFFYDYDQSQTATRDTLFAWTKWLWTDVGIRGFRMDAVKHFDYAFTGDLMDYLHGQGIDPGLVVGEFYDANANTLKTWIDNVYANMDPATASAIQVRAFDFALREALKNACDQFGYDVRNVFQSGIVDGAGGSGFNVVTFVNNHDFRDAGQPVQNDPMLAYAYILTNNQIGMPSVFYPEYFGVSVPNYPNVNLQTQINELIQIHKDYIYQSSHRDYLSRSGTPYSQTFNGGYAHTTLFFQLGGGVAGKDVLVCINFAGEALDMTHGINTDIDGDGTPNLSAGSIFTEVTSNSTTNQLTVSASNTVTIRMPARSYAVWVQGAPLPVELVAFRAEEADEGVRLVWETATEEQFKGFIVERSEDGQHFRALGEVAARAQPGEGARYEWLDRAAPRGVRLYYRLRMQDLDGTESFSPVRQVLLPAPMRLRLAPNPTRGHSRLCITTPHRETVRIEVRDVTGQLVYSTRFEKKADTDCLELPSARWQAGIYFVQVTSATRQESIRLVVQ